jgi:hypothetical protein
MVLEGFFLADELDVYSVLFFRDHLRLVIGWITARSIGAEAGR